MEGKHRRAAKGTSEKILKGSAAEAGARQKAAKLATTKANAASQFALGGTLSAEANRVKGSMATRSSGDPANQLNKTIAYAHAYASHNKAAAAHRLAGNEEEAKHHEKRAAEMEKEFEHHRKLLGD
jgi:hypothetical protein